MIDILRLLETKEDYSKYSSLVLRNNTDFDIKRIVSTIDKWYETNDKIDWVDFRTFFELANPTLKEEKLLVANSIFTSLSTPKSALKSGLLDMFIERRWAERVSFLAMEVAEGRKSGLEGLIAGELGGYTTELGKAPLEASEEVSGTLEELLEDVKPGSGYKWRLPCLNDSLGELPMGRMIQFCGRPDAGKTTLICSEGSFIAQQLPDDKKVLFFTNEESGREIKRRMISSLLGVELEELNRHPLRYWTEYVKLLGGDERKITIIHKPALAKSDVDRWLERERESVGLILFDQLRKLKGFDKQQGVGKLESIFNQGREWAKEFAPLINVSQLGAEADNIAYPGMKTMYESSTTAQGETDAIVNIGFVAGSVPDNLRYLNVVRNKLPWPGVKEMRLAKHVAYIDINKARFTP